MIAWRRKLSDAMILPLQMRGSIRAKQMRAGFQWRGYKLVSSALAGLHLARRLTPLRNLYELSTNEIASTSPSLEVVGEIVKRAPGGSSCRGTRESAQQ